MQTSNRHALATIAGAIVLAAAAIIVGFHANAVLETGKRTLVGDPSSPAALPDRRIAIPDPYLADRS